MKMAIKRKNDEFLVITLKHVDLLGILKLSALAHENGHKTRKRRVFWSCPQTCIGCYIILNRPGTPILWGINHENSHKRKKNEFLVITLKHVNRLGTLKLSAKAH